MPKTPDTHDAQRAINLSSMLHRACLKRDLYALRLALECGADPNSLPQTQGPGAQPLLRTAARIIWTDGLVALLKAGASIAQLPGIDSRPVTEDYLKGSIQSRSASPRLIGLKALIKAGDPLHQCPRLPYRLAQLMPLREVGRGLDLIRPLVQADTEPADHPHLAMLARAPVSDNELAFSKALEATRQWPGLTPMAGITQIDDTLKLHIKLPEPMRLLLETERALLTAWHLRGDTPTPASRQRRRAI